MPKWDPAEKYWSEEEDLLRKRGIDPMQVEQVLPPKFPTHKGNATLHRGKKAKTKRFAKGGMVSNDYRKGKR